MSDDMMMIMPGLGFSKESCLVLSRQRQINLVQDLPEWRVYYHSNSTSIIEPVAHETCSNRTFKRKITQWRRELKQFIENMKESIMNS